MAVSIAPPGAEGASAEEVGQRGETLYAQTLRAQVETPANIGQYLALDIHTGQHEIGPERLAAVERLRARLPDAVVYVVLIGYPAVAAIGGALRPHAR